MITALTAAILATTTRHDLVFAVKAVFTEATTADLDALLAAGPAGLLAAVRPAADTAETLRVIGLEARLLARRDGTDPTQARIARALSATARATRAAVLAN